MGTTFLPGPSSWTRPWPPSPPLSLSCSSLLTILFFLLLFSLLSPSCSVLSVASSVIVSLLSPSWQCYATAAPKSESTQIHQDGRAITQQIVVSCDSTVFRLKVLIRTYKCSKCIVKGCADANGIRYNVMVWIWEPKVDILQYGCQRVHNITWYGLL